MMKDKVSFVFYKDWYLAATGCDDKTQLKLYRAITEYAFLDLEPKDPALQLAFPMIKRKIDEDRSKYDSKCVRYRQIAIERERKKRESQETTIVHDCEQTTTTSTYNDNEHENDNVSTNVDVNKKTSNEEKKDAASAASHAQDLMKARMQKFYDSLIPYVEVYGKKMIREFYDYWTEPNKSGTKFRMEQQPTWSLERRLRTWADREPITGKGDKPTGVQNKPYIVEGFKTAEQLQQEKDDRWQQERDRLSRLVEGAKNDPTGSSAQLVEIYRQNGKLAEYGLE